MVQNSLAKTYPLPITEGPALQGAWSDIADARAALCDVAAQFDPDRPLSAVILFVSPQFRGYQLANSISEVFGQTLVVGCTTSGEVTPCGYREGAIVAVGLYADGFEVSQCAMPNISEIDIETVTENVLEAKRELLRSRRTSERHEFGMLLVDGVTMQEDRLLTMLAPVLGRTPMFGGSAGDSMAFDATEIFFDGRFQTDAGVLMLIRSKAPFELFQFDHFKPTGVRMIVTDADGDGRVVHSINDEPAAKEYARLVGVEVEALDAVVFAANPVMVRIGNKNYVRSIRKVCEGGGLHFYCAIGAGMVLTLAETEDIVEHLRDSIASLGATREPNFILAFDCVLRREEVAALGNAQAYTELMAKNNLIGFNTYGEQFDFVHVNQTFTGVAFYPRLEDDDGK